MPHYHLWNARRLFLGLLAVLTLTGCYASQEALIEKGEYMNIRQKYICENKVAGGTSILDFSVNKDGLFFPSYTYAEAGGDVFKFIDIGNGIFLAQDMPRTSSDVMFLYAKQFGTTLVLMVPNLMSKSASLDAMLREHNLKFERRGKGEIIMLIGAKDEKLAFLKKHTPDLLMEIAICSPM